MLILQSPVRMTICRNITIRLGVLSELAILANLSATSLYNSKSPIREASFSASLKSHICKLKVWPQYRFHAFLHEDSSLWQQQSNYDGPFVELNSEPKG